MDYFVKTLSGIKAKGVRPDLIGSIITHYASKWLPDLLTGTGESLPEINNAAAESVTVSWMKKRFFVETLVGVLPPEKDAIPCNFLLRLLRTANMVGVEPTYQAELERRISWQLDQASLKELMIPSFSHTCGTLLDVELVYRLVKRFVSLDELTKTNGAAAFVKVAKLVDSYLAEAAVDSNLTMTEFVALADALPTHARAMDDGLYRAIDTYLKAHPSASKHERKTLCRLIDCRKLSPEASLHAAQNERLPVRAVIQVLFSEQSKNTSRNNVSDWSGSFSGARSPNPGLEQPTRCLSKREMSVQQMEIRRLKDDVLRLQSMCNSMQIQIEKLSEKKNKSSSNGGFFRWKKFGFVPLSIKSNSTGVSNSVGDHKKNNIDHDRDDVVGFDHHGQQTPIMNMKTKLMIRRGRSPPKLRKSMS
ncbi:hypothetical protein CsatA_021813 [Cannabis sativa]